MAIINYEASYTLKCNANGWYIPRKLIRQIYNGEDPEYFRILREKEDGKDQYIFTTSNDIYDLAKEDEREIIEDIPIGKFLKNKIGLYIRKSTMKTLYPEILISDKIKATPAGDCAILEQII